MDGVCAPNASNGRDRRVNSGFPCLFFLILAVDVINPASALKETAGLMKVERHAVFNALHLGGNDPAMNYHTHAL